MGTLVCFHAHPDDESIGTGGTMAKAAAAGHRVVLVVATGGECGEVPDDLAPGETLLARRRAETMRSAEVLGVARVEWLGYLDSGMTGWAQNGDPASFVQADVEEAALRLAAILREERADVVTLYDWHGNYGHPDHIRVHEVGHRAAELAGTPHVYESTFNRDYMVRQMTAARDAGEVVDIPDGDVEDPASWTDDGRPFGMAEGDLTTQVDVRDFVERKRSSIACHVSQKTDSAFFLEMPEDVFRATFGYEWFIHKGAPPGVHEDALVGLG
jgi:LmbE family N-acetylglucosaminyl deacetylase